MSVLPLSGLAKLAEIEGKRLSRLVAGLAKRVTSGSHTFSAANTTETVATISIPRLATSLIVQGFYRIVITFHNPTTGSQYVNLTVTLKYVDGSTETFSVSNQGIDPNSSWTWDKILPRVDVAEIDISASVTSTSVTCSYHVDMWLVDVQLFNGSVNANSTATLFSNSLNKLYFLTYVKVITGNTNLNLVVTLNNMQLTYPLLDSLELVFITDSQLGVELSNPTTTAQSATVLVVTCIVKNPEAVIV